MMIIKRQGIALALAAAAVAVAVPATGAAAEVRVAGQAQASGICGSRAGIFAYARQNGFSPRYVAMMCNQYSGTHWRVWRFPG